MTHYSKLIPLTFLFLLSGCAIPEKLATLNEPPKLSRIQNPTQLPGYQPVSMPMPVPVQRLDHKVGGSLWRLGSRAFFKDQRAHKVGDIVTVTIKIDQKESIEMKPTITKTQTGSTSIASALGLGKELKRLLPNGGTGDGTDGNKLVDTSSSPSLSGNAKYEVTDKFEFKIAANIIQILPNGNLVIHGRQEIRLVEEVREIELMGVVRKEDVASDNSIDQNKIAQLRISYGGRGELTNMQGFSWGQKLINTVMPF